MRRTSFSAAQKFKASRCKCCPIALALPHSVGTTGSCRKQGSSYVLATHSTQQCAAQITIESLTAVPVCASCSDLHHHMLLKSPDLQQHRHIRLGQTRQPWSSLVQLDKSLKMEQDLNLATAQFSPTDRLQDACSALGSGMTAAVPHLVWPKLAAACSVTNAQATILTPAQHSTAQHTSSRKWRWVNG